MLIWDKKKKKTPYFTALVSTMSLGLPQFSKFSFPSRPAVSRQAVPPLTWGRATSRDLELPVGSASLTVM